MYDEDDKPPKADKTDAGGDKQQPASKQSDAGDEKKPTKDTRFKPGQCGNPKGRPKGSIGWKTKLKQELKKKTTVVTKTGKSVKMSKGDVIITQLADKAMRDFKAAAQVLNWIGDDSVEQEKASTASGSIPQVDREMLRRILKRAERLEEDAAEEEKPVEDEALNNE
jgi:hypothetical protein